MSLLPNSHQALIRNIGRLAGRVVLLGVTEPALLSQIDDDALVMTENVAVYGLMRSSGTHAIVFGYDDPALTPDSFDTVVVFLPKSRAELSMRLALARHLGADSARVLMLGEKKEGIAGAVRQLREQLPQATKVDSARHCQVWQVDGAGSSTCFKLSDWMQWHSIERHGIELDVAGLPGIFSDGELDAGTAMLIDTLAEQPPAPGGALDFACGAGVIGAWWQRFQAREYGAADPVDGVDVQFQAVACANATYARADAAGRIVASNGLEGVDGHYQTVITNPPFHTGVRTDTSITEQFLKTVRGHLLKGGELRLVANRFLPYEPLIRRYIGPSRVMAENSRFVVWSALKS